MSVTGELDPVRIVVIDEAHPRAGDLRRALLQLQFNILVQQLASESAAQEATAPLKAPVLDRTPYLVSDRSRVVACFPKAPKKLGTKPEPHKMRVRRYKAPMTCR